MTAVSAPCKIHLLGEHTVVYGKPALLSAINLRVIVTITPSVIPAKAGIQLTKKIRKVVEPIIKKRFGIKNIPFYQLSITSEFPTGSGLGGSAAISASYIAALLSFLKVKWDKNLVNELAFEAEKNFHGNPSGGDNTTVVIGGLLYFRKEFDFLKSFSPLPFSIHKSFSPFVLIYSGKPEETTKQMIDIAKPKIHRVLEAQEALTKQLVIALRDGNEKLLIKVTKKAERNLEKIGVVGKIAKKIIRDVENLGGAAKISGAGGVKEGSGMLLTYHKNPQILLKYAKENNLEAFIIKLGAEGLKNEI